MTVTPGDELFAKALAEHVPPGWKQMPSGKGIDLANPTPEAIDWNDIAMALSCTSRFNGAFADFDRWYSVAQHSALVCDLMHPMIQVYGLLHDFHEAYWSDDITPKKRLMHAAVPEAAKWLEEQKDKWDRAIWAAARVKEPNDAIRAAVKDADRMALAIERGDLLSPPADEMTKAAWSWLPDPAGFHVIPLGPKEAHALLLSRIEALIWPKVQHEPGHA
jgi:hypothetical protein